MAKNVRRRLSGLKIFFYITGTIKLLTASMGLLVIFASGLSPNQEVAAVINKHMKSASALIGSTVLFLAAGIACIYAALKISKMKKEAYQLSIAAISMLFAADFISGILIVKRINILFMIFYFVMLYFAWDKDLKEQLVN